ncbi:hypothetical protein EB118_07165 [bacterium]|nr:hypothetical protein [bacterium]
MNPGRVNLRIYQGSTFNQMFRWESETPQYATIAAINKSAPCVIVVNTGQPTPPPSWRVRVTGASGMKQINLVDEDDYYISTNTVGANVYINELNSVNFDTYTGGGVLSWNYPVPLGNYTGLMQIRRSVLTSSPLLEITSGSGIEINDTDKYIRVTITKEQTAQLNFSVGVYSLELTNNLGETITFIQGNISLVKEVTR